MTRHAKFDENTFPFAGIVSSVDLAQLVFCQFEEPTLSLPAQSKPSDDVHSVGPSPSKPPASCSLCPDDVPPSTAPTTTTSPAVQQPVTVESPTPPPPPVLQPSVHPMTTRSRAGIFKPKHFADLATLGSSSIHVALFANKDPKGFKSAAKHTKWLEAMNEEMSALRINETWDLVPRPLTSNIVCSKWVFRTKFQSEGSIERYKARLVAQGFTQIPGLDYSHTFSHVVKASTVHIVLSLVVLKNWPLRQLDVKNAFLNGHLNETIYMEQPPGFIDFRYPNHVCHLKKALYGLTQAPRAWFQRLSSFLLQLGFTCSRADTSLFVFKRDSSNLYLLVYVDDIILTGNNT